MLKRTQANARFQHEVQTFLELNINLWMYIKNSHEANSWNNRLRIEVILIPSRYSMSLSAASSILTTLLLRCRDQCIFRPFPRFSLPGPFESKRWLSTESSYLRAAIATCQFCPRIESNVFRPFFFNVGLYPLLNALPNPRYHFLTRLMQNPE